MRLCYFSSSINSFFKRMPSHPVGLDVWFLVGPFLYFHNMWTVKALARRCWCAGLPEHWLVTDVISSIISWAGCNVVLHLGDVSKRCWLHNCQWPWSDRVSVQGLLFAQACLSHYLGFLQYCLHVHTRKVIQLQWHDANPTEHFTCNKVFHWLRHVIDSTTHRGGRHCNWTLYPRYLTLLSFRGDFAEPTWDSLTEDL